MVRQGHCSESGRVSAFLYLTVRAERSREAAKSKCRALVASTSRLRRYALPERILCSQPKRLLDAQPERALCAPHERSFYAQPKRTQTNSTVRTERSRGAAKSKCRDLVASTSRLRGYAQPERILCGQPKRLLDAQPERIWCAQHKRLSSAQPERPLNAQPKRFLHAQPKRVSTKFTVRTERSREAAKSKCPSNFTVFTPSFPRTRESILPCGGDINMDTRVRGHDGFFAAESRFEPFPCEAGEGAPRAGWVRP